MTSALAGRRILVVGASAGIGRSFAAQSIRAGAEVVVAARRADRLTELAGDDGRCTPVVVDVTESANVRNGQRKDCLLYPLRGSG